LEVFTPKMLRKKAKYGIIKQQVRMNTGSCKGFTRMEVAQ